jgi:hypothetical protein
MLRVGGTALIAKSRDFDKLRSSTFVFQVQSSLAEMPF